MGPTRRKQATVMKLVLRAAASILLPLALALATAVFARA